MTLAERTETAVAERVRRLQREYDSVRVFGETIELPAEQFRTELERARAGYVGGASVCVQDGDSRILLDREEPGEPWSMPGGPAEEDEPLEESAHRHVEEQFDIEFVITDLFQINQYRTVSAADPESPTLHSLWAVFDGVCTERVDAPEMWWESKPDRIHPTVEPRVRAWTSANGGGTNGGGANQGRASR